MSFTGYLSQSNQRYLDYFKMLTFKKFWNFIQIETSRVLSLILRKPVVWGVPYTVSIEPTCLCNLKCPECPTGLGITRRENTNLDLALYQNIIDEIKTTTLYLMLYFQGEPFMNRDIFGMIKYASERKIFTVISSNGQFLDNEMSGRIIQAGLDRLIISVDGTDQKTFEKYRVGGDLSRILEGTKYLNTLKKERNEKRPEIIFQFLVFRHNETQVDFFKKFGRSSGADRTWIKSAQVINPDKSLETIPRNTLYSRYRPDDKGVIKIKASLRNKCNRLWRTCVITTDGNIIPCCFDKNAKYKMGDLKNTGFREIWYNQRYMEFRKMILNNRSQTDICNNCTEGIRVYI
jgi:radical SAM protein with 4Fe4S-binding SPASM domain